MKKRTFTLLNFFALNVLFFALYLNFIHKDVNTLPVVSASTKAAVKSFQADAQKNTVAAYNQSHKKALAVAN